MTLALQSRPQPWSALVDGVLIGQTLYRASIFGLGLSGASTVGRSKSKSICELTLRNSHHAENATAEIGARATATNGIGIVHENLP